MITYNTQKSFIYPNDKVVLGTIHVKGRRGINHLHSNTCKHKEQIQLGQLLQSNLEHKYNISAMSLSVSLVVFLFFLLKVFEIFKLLSGVFIHNSKAEQLIDKFEKLSVSSSTVPVVIGFKRTILVQAQVLCLLIRKLRQVCIKSGKMQTGDILI